MVEIYGLKEVWFPEEKRAGAGPKCNLFMSQEFLDRDARVNAGKTALVLIQGNGSVRAGQWARSVCIEEDFHLGSMLP